MIIRNTPNGMWIESKPIKKELERKRIKKIKTRDGLSFV